MYVDQLTSPGSLRAFEKRRNAVFETAARYQIDESNAVVIGGAALALHGIDSHVKLPWELRFDLDVITLEEQEIAPGIQWIPFNAISMQHEVDPEAPLKLTAIKRDIAPLFASRMGYRGYRAMLADRVVIDGLATVPISGLVRSKMSIGSMKHHASLIKAHAVAMATECAVVGEPYWEAAVIDSMNFCSRIARWGPPTNLPRWLGELTTQDFNHPAFAKLRTGLLASPVPGEAEQQ